MATLGAFVYRDFVVVVVMVMVVVLLCFEVRCWPFAVEQLKIPRAASAIPSPKSE